MNHASRTLRLVPLPCADPPLAVVQTTELEAGAEPASQWAAVHMQPLSLLRFQDGALAAWDMDGQRLEPAVVRAWGVTGLAEWEAAQAGRGPDTR